MNDATNIAGMIVSTIQRLTRGRPTPLHEPSFAGNEWTYLKDCLDSTFVSSAGKYVDRFEADLAAYTGASHAVVAVNGTAALQVALQLAGVQPGDEVIVPALTFVATAAAVRHCHAIPHLADSEERTLGMDPAALKAHLGSIADVTGGICANRLTGRTIRAIVPMHTFGHPADIDALVRVAGDYHLAVVEDAAESLGSWVGFQHTGTFGLVGMLSFNGNKTITTGGGGALLTNDPELARRAKHLTTTAKVPHPWEFRHDAVGYNYRMPNLNAALGCAQLEQLPTLVECQRELYAWYADAFASLTGARIVKEPEGCHSNYWLQTLLLDESLVGLRDQVLAATNAAGILTRPAWTLVHQLLPYASCPRMPLPQAESLARRIINLPSSASLLPGLPALARA